MRVYINWISHKFLVLFLSLFAFNCLSADFNVGEPAIHLYSRSEIPKSLLISRIFYDYMQQVAYNNEKLFHLLASVNILILEGLAGIFCP